MATVIDEPAALAAGLLTYWHEAEPMGAGLMYPLINDLINDDNTLARACVCMESDGDYSTVAKNAAANRRAPCPETCGTLPHALCVRWVPVRYNEVRRVGLTCVAGEPERGQRTRLL